MLQSLAGKLNRLNDVREIGATIVNELRMLVDYHSCRVYIADGLDLLPIAWRGDLGPYQDERAEELQSRVGEGITGRAGNGAVLLIPNALEIEWAVTIPGTDDIEESMIAVPLKYGARVIGVVVISKLGIGQFDEDDVRLLEVLAGTPPSRSRTRASTRRSATRPRTRRSCSRSRTPSSTSVASSSRWKDWTRCSSASWS